MMRVGSVYLELLYRCLHWINYCADPFIEIGTILYRIHFEGREYHDGHSGEVGGVSSIRCGWHDCGVGD